jgi:hypothetical protein
VKADIRINQGNTFRYLGQYDKAKAMVTEGIEIANNLESVEL